MSAFLKRAGIDQLGKGFATNGLWIVAGIIAVVLGSVIGSQPPQMLEEAPNDRNFRLVERHLNNIDARELQRSHFSRTSLCKSTRVQ